MPFPVSMDATWLDGSVQFDGVELRRADSSLFIGDGVSPLGVRGGIVRHSDTSLAVTVNASDVLTVQPGAAAIPGNSGVGNGVYRAALAAATTGNLTARNATNPRIDLVIFRVLDTSVVGSHTEFTGRIEILTGVAASVPTTPALPSLAIELARISVPAAGGGAVTVDSSFRLYACSVGGTLAVPSFARLPTQAANRQKAVALDTGVEYMWDSTAWRRKFVTTSTALVFPGGVQQHSATVSITGDFFSQAPRIAISCDDPRFAVSASNITATSFTMSAYFIPGVPGAGFSLGINWIAMLP